MEYYFNGFFVFSVSIVGIISTIGFSGVVGAAISLLTVAYLCVSIFVKIRPILFGGKKSDDEE